MHSFISHKIYLDMHFAVWFDDWKENETLMKLYLKYWMGEDMKGQLFLTEIS